MLDSDIQILTFEGCDDGADRRLPSALVWYKRYGDRLDVLGIVGISREDGRQSPRIARLNFGRAIWSDKPFDQRKDWKDLWAKGEESIGAVPLEGSRIRPPRMFGVWAQYAQTYTVGRLRRSMFTQ